MITVNIRQAKEITKMLVQEGEPVIWLGSPGAGKTSGVKQVAQELAWGFRYEDGTSLDPTDARGVLVPNLKTQESFFTRPAILPKEEEGKRGILLIDEVAGCLPATQKALQPIFRKEKVGEYRLIDGWVPVGTGNYASDGAGTFALLTSLQDSCCMLNVEPSFEAWKEDFALPQGVHSDVIGFLNYRRELFSTFDKRNKADRGKGFGSARSYTKASNAMKAGISEELLPTTLAGYLGEGIAVELMAFIRLSSSLPDILKIYRKQSNAVPKQPDVLYALSSALVGFLGALPEDLSLQIAVDRLLEYSMRLPAEFAILTLKDALALYGKELFRSDLWGAFGNKFGDLVL